MNESINLKKDEFHRLLGKLVHLTAQFDFNVGLQLTSLGSLDLAQGCTIDFEVALHPTKTQLGTRLKQLRRLICYVFEKLNQAVPTEIGAWFLKAEESRALRNDYVHGRWGFTGGSKFILCFTPLNWDFSVEKAKNGQEIRMTLTEFSAQVKAAEVIFGEFDGLFRKHIRQHSPS